MFGERRERAAGRENLLEKPLVGRVRSMEGPADRYGLTQRIGMHPSDFRPEWHVASVPLLG